MHRTVVRLFLILLTTGRISSNIVDNIIPDSTSFAYYDSLRATIGDTTKRESDGTNVWIAEALVESNNPNHLGRNLHRVTMSSDMANLNETMDTETDVDLENNNDSTNSIILCHVPIIFRWTNPGTAPEDYVDVSEWAYGGSAAAMLAIHHFNTGNDVLVKELKDIQKTCNIRLTTELIDSESSAFVAMRALSQLITRSPTNVLQPQPCAILGSSWSSVTKKIATVTGVLDILQVTSSASSVDLDDVQEYPLFARTHPSDAAMAELSVRYFHDQLNVKYCGLLYVDTEFGEAYKQQVVASVALYKDMLVHPVSFRSTSTFEDIEVALKELSSFTYIIAVIVGKEQYMSVMEVAGKLGLAGPKSFWLFSGALASSLVDQSLAFPKDSFAAKATFGNAIIHDEGGLPGFPQFDTFQSSWTKLGYDAQSLNYINSMQPPSPMGTFLNFSRPQEYFDKRPSHIATFSYDAIVAIGLSACRRAAKHNISSGDLIFSGRDHHDELVHQDVFRGATGDVVIGPDTYSRSANSTYFVISNILPVPTENDNESNTTHTSFQGIPKTYYDTDTQSWKTYSASKGDEDDNRFIYPNGSSQPPVDAVEDYENFNYILPTYRWICLGFAAAGMVLSVVCFVVTVVGRRHQVLLAAQPPFLMLVCCGTLLISSAIIPASLDDSILTQHGCTIACTSTTWLFSIGFVILFSALFSKLWRINKLFQNALRLKRAKIKPKDVMIPFLLLLVLNLATLLVWTILSPITWQRKTLSSDALGRPRESIGQCTSNGYSMYGVVLIAINGVAMVLALIQAYHARNIKTEFGESEYIAMAMICIFQSLVLGVPLLVLVRDDSPTALLFVQTGILSVISIAILVLLFVPKFKIMKHGLPRGYNNNGGTTSWFEATTSSHHRSGTVTGRSNIPAPSSASSTSSYAYLNTTTTVSGLRIPSGSYASSHDETFLDAIEEGEDCLHESFANDSCKDGSVEATAAVAVVAAVATCGDEDEHDEDGNENEIDYDENDTEVIVGQERPRDDYDDDKVGVSLSLSLLEQSNNSKAASIPISENSLQIPSS